MQSHSKVLGVRTSVYELQRNTIQPTIAAVNISVHILCMHCCPELSQFISPSAMYESTVALHLHQPLQLTDEKQIPTERSWKATLPYANHELEIAEHALSPTCIRDFWNSLTHHLIQSFRCLSKNKDKKKKPLCEPPEAHFLCWALELGRETYIPVVTTDNEHIN